MSTSFTTRSGILLLLFLTISLPDLSQVSNNRELFVDNLSPITVRTIVQEVDIFFTVTDHHGRLVRDLTQSQIAVYDNGVPPERVTYFTAHMTLPLRLALVIDVSDSVLGRVQYEKEAAQLFCKHMIRSTSDVGLVVAFNDRSRIEQSATHDTRLLTRAIRNMPTGGKTAIFDAIALASKELGNISSNQPSLKAIIVMSDGDDNASRTTLQDAENIAQQNESAVFILNTALASLKDAKAEATMKEMAEVTGGHYFNADTEHIKSALDKLEKELRSEYAIGYKPAYVQPDGSFHKLSILVPRKLLVRHRQGYFAR